MGRPLPGYRVALIDADGLESDTGEIVLPLRPRSVGLMTGYQNERGELMAIEGEYYRTGDVVSRDADGAITFIGRADDVFKSSDYRLSPFELESVLIEHAAVAEAAVGPAPDPVRYTIAKGYVALAQGHAADRETAAAIFKHMRARLSAYKLVRRIEFVELPKTIWERSGGSNCASAKRSSRNRGNERRRNSGSRIFRRNSGRRSETAPPGRDGAEAREGKVALHRGQGAMALGGLDVLAGALGDIFPMGGIVIDGRCSGAGRAGAGGAVVLAGERDAVALVGARLHRGGTRLGGGCERGGE